MPFPVAAAIAAGTSLIGGFLSNQSQDKANHENREFSREMYGRQRSDALADRAFENEYNSPAAQMARLTAAGLNPNLVYGNGAAQSSSINTRASKADTPTAQPLNFGFLQNAFMAAFDVVKTQGQINLLEQQVRTQKEMGDYYNSLGPKMRSETGLNEAKMAGQQIANFIQGQTKDVQIDKSKADLKFTIDENERRAAMNAANVKQAVENILLLRAKTAQSDAERQKINKLITTLDQQITINQADVEWSKLAVTGKNQLLPKIALMLVQRLLK